ncbi:MAG: YihY/virulence factor BrkB family protein [Mycobacterium sp.]
MAPSPMTLDQQHVKARPSRRSQLLVGLTGVAAGVLIGRLQQPKPPVAVTAGQGDSPLATDPGRDLDEAPSPDDPAKPESPTDLSKPSLLYVLRKTAREFSTDQCTDLAAALTYYAVLSLFPALVVVVSLLGVFGQGQRTTEAVLEIVGDVGPASAVDTLRAPIQQLVEAPSAGFALVVGILGAVWSASGYIGAFGRAMNRMYEVEEGRPVWKLRPLQLVITLIGLALAAAVAFMLAVSGPLASAVGRAIGLGSAAETVWNIARWPVMLIFVILAVATLYYATPNVQQPKFKWISVGAGVAILIWIVASVGFGFYVSNFGSYNKTYGALAGVIVFLLWLWITNLALLFGAELDAELERGRQLQAGIPAERDLQLPLRDDSGVAKNEAKEQKDIESGRELRETHGRES